MKRILTILFVLVNSVIYSQATLTDLNLVFDISESNSYSSPFVVKGTVLHSTSEYNGNDINVGDLVYFQDGTTTYSLPIITIDSQSYSYVELQLIDISSTVSYVPTGRAALIRTSNPDLLPVPPDGIPSDLEAGILNDLRLKIQGGVTAAEEITDYTGGVIASPMVPPAVAASSYTGKTWRNSMGVLYRSDGVAWTPIGGAAFDTLYTDATNQVLVLQGPNDSLSTPIIDIAPVQSITAGTGISVVPYPGGVFNIVNTGDTDPTNDITTISSGTGIAVSGTGNSRTITNTAPDQVVTITGTTGTYPNFTIVKELPTQTGNNGKALYTNGTTPYWGTVASSIDTFGVYGSNLLVSLLNDGQPAKSVTASSILSAAGGLTGSGAAYRFGYFNSASNIVGSPSLVARADGTRIGFGFYEDNNALTISSIGTTSSTWALKVYSPSYQTLGGFRDDGSFQVGVNQIEAYAAGDFRVRNSTQDNYVRFQATGTNPEINGMTFLGAAKTMYIQNNAGSVNFGPVTTNQAKVHIRGTDNLSTSLALKVQGSTDNNALVVLNNGYVGFGTGSPSSEAHFKSDRLTGYNGQILYEVSKNSAQGVSVEYKRPDNTKQLLFGFSAGSSPDGGMGSMIGHTESLTMYSGYGTSSYSMVKVNASSGTLISNMGQVNTTAGAGLHVLWGTDYSTNALRVGNTSGSTWFNVRSDGLTTLGYYPNTLNSAGSPVNILSTSSTGVLESHTAAEIVGAGGGITGTLVANRIPYTNGTSSLTTSANLTSDGSEIQAGLLISGYPSLEKRRFPNVSGSTSGSVGNALRINTNIVWNTTTGGVGSYFFNFDYVSGVPGTIRPIIGTIQINVLTFSGTGVYFNCSVFGDWIRDRTAYMYKDASDRIVFILGTTSEVSSLTLILKDIRTSGNASPIGNVVTSIQGTADLSDLTLVQSNPNIVQTKTVPFVLNYPTTNGVPGNILQLGNGAVVGSELGILFSTFGSIGSSGSLDGQNAGSWTQTAVRHSTLGPTMIFRQNTTNRVIFRSDGKVGIGIPDPVNINSQFHVTGSGNNSTTWTAQFHNNATNNALMIRDDGFVGIGTASPTVKLHVAGGGLFGVINNAAYDYVQISESNGSGNPEIKMFNSGLVDARLTAEYRDSGSGFVMNKPLYVDGRINTTGEFSAVGLNSLGVGVLDNQATPGGALRLRSVAGAKTYISFVEDGVAFRGSLGYLGGSGDLIYKTGSTNLTDGTERFRITSTGNVGIGATPAQTFHVQGTARITGSDGTATTIMGRDGDGDVSVLGLGSGLSITSGVLNVSATGATNLAVTGTASPLTLTSDTGTDVTFTAGPAGVSLTGTSGNITINNTGDTNAADDLTTSTLFDGDIDGTYNGLAIKTNIISSDHIIDGNVTMAKIANAGATSGQIISWNGTAWTPSNIGYSGTGDVAGTAASLTVSKIQGRGVATTAPTSGQVLAWSGSLWAPTTLSTGITSLNGQTGTTQSFFASSTGTDFAISSSGNVHTFVLPTANATQTGKLTSSDWTTFNSKASIGGTPAADQLAVFTNGTTISSSSALSYSASTLTVAGDISPTGKLKAGTLGSTPTVIVGRNASNEISTVTVGAGLSFNTGTGTLTASNMYLADGSLAGYRTIGFGNNSLQFNSSAATVNGVEQLVYLTKSTGSNFQYPISIYDETATQKFVLKVASTAVTLRTNTEDLKLGTSTKEWSMTNAGLLQFPGLSSNPTSTANSMWFNTTTNRLTVKTNDGNVKSIATLQDDLVGTNTQWSSSFNIGNTSYGNEVTNTLTSDITVTLGVDLTEGREYKLFNSNNGATWDTFWTVASGYTVKLKDVGNVTSSDGLLTMAPYRLFIITRYGNTIYVSY